MQTNPSADTAAQQPKEKQQTQAELSEILQVRRQKLDDLRARGCDPFTITKFEKTHHSTDVQSNFEALEGQTVAIAGRLMAKRVMGKAAFAHLQDERGRIQFYCRRDDIGVEEYKDFKAMDIGDIVGVVGHVFKTQTGEISVHADSVHLLAKSLLPLPEKFHGLKDQDLRYRQRQVDMIVNPHVREAFVVRTKVIKEFRRILDDLDYLEVETPILQTQAGGANARPFITHHNTLDIDMYLRIATELHLKRLIIGGMERVYELGRIFRNEGMSVKHNPEFTTVELYQAYADYATMMDICEQLFAQSAQKVLGSPVITYQGEEIDLTPPWRRITMADAVKQCTGVDFMALTDEQAIAAAKQLGMELAKQDNCRGRILNAAFEEYVEHTLMQPTFIVDYPVEVSPLAKRKPDQPEMTERFEAFVYGREVANAFSELNDPIDQRERFLSQAAARAAGDDEAQVMDNDFVQAMEVGMPPTGGMGIGIDRLVMLLTDSSTIRDVILFPTMKPRE